MADPSPHPLPGSRAGYTEDNNFALKVPLEHGATYAKPQTPFEQYAASVLSTAQQLLRRLRSQHLSTTAVNDKAGWNLTRQKTRAVGEVWAYGEYDFTRTGGTITVPPNGNLDNIDLGTVADPWVPRSLARLFSVNTGVLASGYVLASGDLTLSSLNSGRDIQTGDIITLAGMWPLLVPFDSEA